MSEPITSHLEHQRILMATQQYAARAGIGPAVMATAQLQSIVYDDMLRGMVYELSVMVREQVLAPEVHQLKFSRKVPVKIRYTEREYRLRRRRDYFLAWLPRWLRWREPEEIETSSHRGVRLVDVVVDIDEEVHIERRLSYPDSSEHLPPERWGEPVYVERFVHKEKR